MSKLTLVVGMAASGKSHFARELAQTRGLIAYHDFTLIKMTDHRQRAGHEKFPEMVAKLVSGTDCIADEPHLVDPAFFSEFVAFTKEHLVPVGVEIEWIHFEKDVRACATNLVNDWEQRKKGNKARCTALLNQIAVYKPPTGTDLRACYVPSSGRRYKNEEEAKAALIELRDKFPKDDD